MGAEGKSRGDVFGKGWGTAVFLHLGGFAAGGIGRGEHVKNGIFEIPLHVAQEDGAEVAGSGELALLLVAGRLDGAEDEGFQLAQVAVADGEVDGESVPGVGVAVAQVLLEAVAEVGGEADVVELAFAVEDVDAMAAPHVLADDVLVFLEGRAGYVFEMLADELGVAFHGGERV